MAGGWIKLEKSLFEDDPRVLQMARKLAERDRAAGYAPLPRNRLLVTCVGAVSKLWKLADQHVDVRDELPLGPADIDELTGIEGFCELMPAEWLQVIDAHRVKLPGYHAHNNTQAKKNLNNAERQQRWRNARALRQALRERH